MLIKMKNSINPYNLQDLKKLNLLNKKIGILGGSFNPAHKGHLMLSEEALKLGLDLVIWVVALQNPLKPNYMLSFEDRIVTSLEITKNNNKIIVSSIENEISSTNSFDMLKFLCNTFSGNNFVWIMGVDCLDKFHLWENYDHFTDIVGIFLFNRKNYTHLIQSSIASKNLFTKINTCNIDTKSVVLFDDILSDISSTEIRKLRRKTNMQATELKELIIKLLEDKSAENINVIDLSNKTSLTRFMVFANGRSSRNVNAIADYIADELKKAGCPHVFIEGAATSEWVLMDAGDVMLHLFQPETRDKYKLEALWGQ